MKTEIRMLQKSVQAFVTRFPRATRPAAAGYVLTILADIFEQFDDLPVAVKLQALAAELVGVTNGTLDRFVVLNAPGDCLEASKLDSRIAALVSEFKGG
jgi:hypothetical protein